MAADVVQLERNNNKICSQIVDMKFSTFRILCFLVGAKMENYVKQNQSCSAHSYSLEVWLIHQAFHLNEDTTFMKLISLGQKK